jgi:hypothetical protein
MGTALAAVTGTSFYKIRVGKVVYTLQILAQTKRPIILKKGTELVFLYDEAEIINVARLLTASGELMLETRSLEAEIFLSTSHLPKGKYVFEVQSGEQRADGKVVVQ